MLGWSSKHPDGSGLVPICYIVESNNVFCKTGMATIRTTLQLPLLVALLCFVSCSLGLPRWGDVEEELLATMEEGEVAGGDEELETMRYCLATARVTGKSSEQCFAIVGETLTVKGEIPETRSKVCSALQREAIKRLQRKYPTGCVIEADQQCNGC